MTSSGQVRYQLKAPYRDGTTHIVMEPLDLIARLAALIPPPRMHLTRYHGVFAPHSRLRARVTPAKRGVGATKPADQSGQPQQPATPRHEAMNWARRLKRVFGVEIEGCARCGGKLKIIASIDEPAVIARIQSASGQGSRGGGAVAVSAWGAGAACAAAADLNSMWMKPACPDPK
jgi:Putative transposase